MNQLRGNDQQAVGFIHIVGIVILVIILRLIELLEFLYFRHDRLPVSALHWRKG
jgi:hypothetical protein